MYRTFNEMLIIISLCFSLVNCVKNPEPDYSKIDNFGKKNCMADLAVDLMTFTAMVALENKIGGGSSIEEASIGGSSVNCMVGAYIGLSVAKRTDTYINAQQAIEAEVARNKKHIIRMKKNNKQLTLQTQRYEKIIHRVSTKRKKRKQNSNHLNRIKNHLENTISKADADFNYLSKEIITTTKLHEKYNIYIKNKQHKNWSQEIAVLNQEKNILDKHIKSLIVLSNSL